MSHRHHFAVAGIAALAGVLAASSCTLNTEGEEIGEPDAGGGGKGGGFVTDAPIADLAARDRADDRDVRSDRAGDTRTDVPDVGTDVVCGSMGVRNCEGVCIGIHEYPDKYGCSANNCNKCMSETAKDGNAHYRCQESKCIKKGCLDGFEDCDTINQDCEIDIDTNPKHCGTCEFDCTDKVPHVRKDRIRCSDGKCAFDDPVDCEGYGAATGARYRNCDGEELDGCETRVDNNKLHCGDCNVECKDEAGAKKTCLDGHCVIDHCTGKWANCDQNPDCETDLTQAKNCGKCGEDCTARPHAENTKCVHDIFTDEWHCGLPVCNPGWGDCGNTGTGCTDNLGIDPVNCGTCGGVCNDTHGKGQARCNNALCSMAGCDENWGFCRDAAPASSSQNKGCDTDLKITPAHCGVCGGECSNANGHDVYCEGSVCHLTCNAGYGDCLNTGAGDQDDGCETNTDSSVSNCGECKKECVVPNGTPSCVGGNCQKSACNPGWQDCDQDPATCETNITTTTNCGTCNNQCTVTSGTPKCTSGSCSLAVCDPGMADCNNDQKDCEIKISEDIDNCGSCGNKCSRVHATPTCSSNSCTYPGGCHSGFANCDTYWSNDCETDLSMPATCGSCTTVCNHNNGTATCTQVSGQWTCGIQCDGSHGDCDGDSQTNGCETPTQTSIQHCGGCNNQCNSDNGSPSCSNGSCKIACNNGWGDCDGEIKNGCEKDLTNDPQNCLKCKEPCPAQNGTPHCSAAGCSITCDSGWGNCTSANGCETQLDSTANCGACGTVCNATNGTANCSGGVCGLACSDPFADCDGYSQTNGCEINTSNDPDHCGSCSTVCPTPDHAQRTCLNKSCGFACDLDWGNCDTNDLNGCETDLMTTRKDCGYCGNDCTPDWCVNGSCE